MAEQTFRSPGFFEQEIDLSTRTAAQLGTPAGIIGTSDFGPAFVPVTVGNFRDFETRFGGLNPRQFGPYAVREFLKYRNAVTFTRVLGAGSNSTTGDIANTSLGGIVKNAGFKVQSTGTKATLTGQKPGGVVFITAKHTIPANSDIGFPVFTDNDTFPTVREKTTFAKAVITLAALPGDGETLSIVFGDGNTPQVITFSTGGGSHETSFSSNAADIQRGTAATAAGAAAAVQVIVNNVSGYTATVSGETVTIIADTAVKTTNDLTVTHTLGAAPTIAVTNGDSLTATADTAFLVRAGIMTTTASNVFIFDTADFAVAKNSVSTDLAAHDTSRRFKVGIFSSQGQTFGDDDGINGFRMFTASLDPNDAYYVGKVLNTDPDRFAEEQHLLYWDYSVEDELAQVGTSPGSIALVSGSGASVTGAGATVSGGFNELYGRFDTRYAAPKTTKFISQPFGATEFDLFHFECISDGAYANDKFKVSIADIRGSTDPNNDYGTFEVQIRKFDDSDLAPEILERFPALSLDPNNERFIARVIGDFKVRFNFDEANEDERRLVLSGKYPNRSAYVRVKMTDEFESGEVPAAALPFGFRGLGALNTSPTRTNPSADDGSYSLGTARLFCKDDTTLTGSIVPPLPYRFKVTKGAVNSSPVYVGEPGLRERADARFYWGVKFDRIASGSANVLNANAGSEINPLVRTYTKLTGIQKLDALTAAGAQSDTFNNHKFTLARVALRQQLTAGGEIDTNSSLTGSASTHMKEAAYIRNGSVDPKTYTVRDPVEATDRITLATLVNSSSLIFNRFTGFAKFTNIFSGGFDGLNIFDSDKAQMLNAAAIREISDSTAQGGVGGPTVASYRKALEVVAEKSSIDIQLLAIPGLREPAVTDFAIDKTEERFDALYIMDIEECDYTGTAGIVTGSVQEISVTNTAAKLQARSLDTSFAAAYFPDCLVRDPASGANVRCPPSVAVLGAMSLNDSVAHPWFAPAGFTRGALATTEQTQVKLNRANLDTLYEVDINPITSFPTSPGVVVFGQKTLQQAQSALDRVNVRRLLIDIRRKVRNVANTIIFEPNRESTLARFSAAVQPILARIQAQQGLDRFKVVIDSSTTTQLDVENNTVRGKIFLQPTKSVEFISLDFVVTNQGAEI